MPLSLKKKLNIFGGKRLYIYNMYLSSILQQPKKPNLEWWTRLTDIIMPTLIIGGGFSPIAQNKL